MTPEELDKRTQKLGGACYLLRQSIDVHRLISLNVEKLIAADASKNFFGFLQDQAVRSIAITTAAIYERPKKKEREPNDFILCSIPAILHELSDVEFSPDCDRERFTKFALKHGADPKAKSARLLLRGALLATIKKHKSAFTRLRTIRNKMAAHIELLPDHEKDDSAPSHESYEAILEFAVDVYDLLTYEFNNAVPAPMPKYVEQGFMRTMEKLGVNEPQRFFKD